MSDNSTPTPLDQTRTQALLEGLKLQYGKHPEPELAILIQSLEAGGGVSVLEVGDLQTPDQRDLKVWFGDGIKDLP